MVDNVSEITADALTMEPIMDEEDGDSIARGASFRETAVYLRTTF